MNALPYGSLCPIDIVVGIDSVTFELRKGQPFGGIKNIPPGIHVVHWGDESMRYGYWFDTQQKYCIRYTEAFELVRVSDDDTYEKELASHWQFMVTYPEIKQWQQLAQYVSQEQVHNITGSALGYADSSMTTAEETELLNRTLAGSRSTASAPVDEHKFHYQMVKFKSSQAIREDHKQEDFLDKSYYLNHVLLPQVYNHRFDRLLGEMQFAFLNAMVFGNYGSSMQWHTLIELICLSSRVSSDTMSRVDRVLSLQLASLQQEYVDFLLNPAVWDRVLNDSFQRGHLGLTREMLDRRAPDLLEEVQRDDESDDFQPTVVGGVYYRQR